MHRLLTTSIQAYQSKANDIGYLINVNFILVLTTISTFILIEVRDLPKMSLTINAEEFDNSRIRREHTKITKSKSME